MHLKPQHCYIYLLLLVAGSILSLIFDTISDYTIFISRKDSFQQVSLSEEVFMTTTPSLDAKARQMSKNVRVLCWILTCPKYHTTKARAVKNTWGKRCNKLIFVSTVTDVELGSIALGVKEDSYKMLWFKTREAFKLLYDQYLHDYDWFFKVDDDTYVIMENLRYMLTPYDPEFPIAFGSRYTIKNDEYLDGGPGYVLSREALRRYGTYAYNDSAICASSLMTSEEDVQITRCLLNVGVLLGDSRDSLGLGRFHHFPPRDVITSPKLPQWHYDRMTFKQDRGIENTSDVAVSFHWLPPQQMYELEYLIYKLRPIGVQLPDISLPAPLPPDTNSIPKKVLENYRHSVINNTNATLNHETRIDHKKDDTED